MKHDKICNLKGVYDTDASLYAEIYGSLKAPDWAGYNLDALFDILTAQIEGPIKIIWADFDQVQKQNINMNLNIAALIQEAADERPDLSLQLN